MRHISSPTAAHRPEFPPIHQRSRKAGLSQGGDRPAFSVPINSLSEVGNFEQGRESCLQVVSKPSDASRKSLYY
ncbi:hypothetical protein Mal52_59860 [Symmachiella dynata]|uniref:Uncharacterized protein n=1 Tax=Symmachiella dynata TaxID=2527995 RepID=A0A517ZYB4_9PLAN|nr:hypothetical protein Mal52_59860 [Symmachiella dynata]